MTRGTRATLGFQLAGFVLFGLIAGEAFAYRIAKEREFTMNLLMTASVRSLTETAVRGI